MWTGLTPEGSDLKQGTVGLPLCSLRLGVAAAGTPEAIIPTLQNQGQKRLLKIFELLAGVGGASPLFSLCLTCVCDV